MKKIDSKDYKRPSIAVVIPAYNAEETVETAILSALCQVDPPEETIVVDDGSTDNTVTVVNKFSDRVRLISQGNQGSAVARQTGTAAANSDYIAYLDSDDWWPEGKITRCREIIAKEDINFMLMDLQRARPGDAPEAYLEKNNSFFPWVKEYFTGRASKSGINNLFKLEPEIGLSLLLHGFPVFPSTVLVKRSVVGAVGGWDARFRRCQDFDIGLRIARRFPLHYLDEVQAIIGLHGGNDDAYAYIVKQTEGDIRVLKAHLEAEQTGSPYYRQVSEALGHKYCGLGYLHRKAGKYKLARQSYAQALRWPGHRMHALIRWILLYKL